MNEKRICLYIFLHMKVPQDQELCLIYSNFTVPSRVIGIESVK